MTLLCIISLRYGECLFRINGVYSKQIAGHSAHWPQCVIRLLSSVSPYNTLDHNRDVIPYLTITPQHDFPFGLLKGF